MGDPAISQSQAVTGTSIHTEYANRKIPIVLGNNDVSAGINRVAQYLRAERWHITANCVNLIYEIKKYRWKVWANKKLQVANNPYEQPHKKDDHALDSARYFFMGHTRPLSLQEEEASRARRSLQLGAEVAGGVSLAISSSPDNFWTDRVTPTTWDSSNSWDDDTMGNEW